MKRSAIEEFKIMEVAYKVYNGLGHGFLEAVYQEALEIEVQKQGIPYEREIRVQNRVFETFEFFDVYAISNTFYIGYFSMSH